MELEVILDSGNESLKTLYEEPLRPSNKRIKLSESLSEIVEAVEDRKVKKVLKKMTQKDLEIFIAERMDEIIANKSEIGRLRSQCKCFQESVEKWKGRAKVLSKQCTDISIVMRKHIVNKKRKRLL